MPIKDYKLVNLKIQDLQFDPDNPNVWDIVVNTNKEREHFAVKPTQLMTRAIKNSTDEHDIVFDPFLGSGSTMISCEQTKRVCYGVEIDAHYVDVCVKRWEDFTGNKAVLVKDKKVKK